MEEPVEAITTKKATQARGWGALFSTRGTGRVEGKQEVIFELVIAVLLKH